MRPEISSFNDAFAYAERVATENKAAIAFEDANPFPEPNQHFLDTREKLTGGQRSLQDAKTLHDFLSDYPNMVSAYKRGGFEALGMRGI